MLFGVFDAGAGVRELPFGKGWNFTVTMFCSCCSLPLIQGICCTFAHNFLRFLKQEFGLTERYIHTKLEIFFMFVNFSLNFVCLRFRYMVVRKQVPHGFRQIIHMQKNLSMYLDFSTYN